METKKQILLIEDEVDMAEELALCLRCEGWKILLAFDGEEGLDKATTLRPDIILLDYLLPKMDGVEVCKALRANPGTKTIPVMMISAKTQSHDLEAAFKAGANDYFIKPYQVKDLIEKIKFHLGTVEK